MEITAKIIGELVNGTIEGDANVVIRKPAKIEEATAGSITFLANMKYESFLYTTGASAVLVERDFVAKQPVKATLIRVDNVYDKIRFLLEKFSEMNVSKPTTDGASLAFVHNSVTVDESTTIGAFSYVEQGATIGKNTTIYPQVYIGEGAVIGDNVTLFAGVKIHNGCKIGDNCVINANAVIGSDGFGFVPQADGTFKKMPQIGIVILEKDVEIGANATIDRASLGATIIKAGAKIDNLVMIAHNVEVGENTAIAAQTGIAGSTKLGKNCMVGGQVGIVGHIQVADGTRIQAQSGIAKPIKEANKAWYGSPAFEYSSFLKSQVYFQKLPALEKRIKELEKLVKKLSE